MTSHVKLFATMMLSVVMTLQTSQAGDEIFSITPYDQAKHMYATIDNEFDSSLVRFQIGEFNLIRSGINTALLFNKTGWARAFQRGSNTTGMDPVLSNKFKTIAFVPASGDSIGFYREAMMKTLHCKQAAEPGDPNPAEDMGSFPETWKTVVGGVQDTSIVVIKIEKLSDTTIYATLDSVAIYPNPSGKFVGHGGTFVDAFKHIRAVPSNMTGFACRIRIVVTRLGSTPLGMAGQFSPENIAFSAYKSRATGTIWSDAQIDSVVARYRELSEIYIRSVSETANHWTAFSHIVLPDSTLKRIMSDYFIINTDSTWATYTPIYEYLDTAGIYLLEDEDTKVNYAHRPGSSPKSSYYTVGGLKNSRTKVLEIMGAWVNASRSGLLVKTKISPNVKTIQWRIVDLQGRTLDEGFVWPTFTKQGIVDIPYRWTATGPVFLQFLDENTKQLSTIGVYPTR